MTALLVLDSSPRNAESSFSKQMTSYIAKRLIARGLVDHATNVDLSATTPPLINQEWIDECFNPQSQASDVLAYSNKVTDDWKQHDVIVVGAPMYNFGPTVLLKAYVDQLVRYDRTFTSPPETTDQLSENNKHGLSASSIPYRGLLDARKIVILVVCSSWSFSDTSPLAECDFLTPWFKAVMALIGIKNVLVLRADSLEDVEVGFKTRNQKLRELEAEADQLIEQVGTLAKTMSAGGVH